MNLFDHGGVRLMKITLRDLLDQFTVAEIGGALAQAGLPQAGSKVERIERFLSQPDKPAKELLALFTAQALGLVCDMLRFTKGRKDEMIEGLVSLLDAGSVASSTSEIRQDVRSEPMPKAYLPVTKQAVLDHLQQLIVPRRKLSNEIVAMDVIGDHLAKVFEDVVSQYNIGGYLGLKIDLDIGNGGTGIEVKLADSLLRSTAEIHRLIGQAIYYQKKRYGNNLLVSIVGLRDELDAPTLKETYSFLESVNITCVRVPAA